MNIIKLNAIPSTNDYLKDLAVSSQLKDFTVVVAEHQTKGKGQMGAVWKVEPSTSLTFSILMSNDLIKIDDIFTVNIIVANTIHKVLNILGLTNITVKWPNDIMSYNKKIGGILIENNIKNNGKIQSIVGIGINISQLNFDDLPQASSILKNHNVLLDKFKLLTDIVNLLQITIGEINFVKASEWNYYHLNLFKKDVPMTFETNKGILFTGMIKNINELGQLGVLNEDEIINYFSLKEIKMHY